MKIKLYKTEISFLVITVFTIGLMFQLNDVTRHIRVRELRLLLLKDTNEDNNLDHIGLVANYRIQKKKYEKLINQKEADIEEMRVASILTDRLFVRKVPIDKYTYISKPALALINFFRSIIGKSPIIDPEDDRASVLLEMAYYYERNSYFAKALEIYNKAIKEEIFDKSKIAAIHLHRGYCHAIKREYSIAKRELHKVIDNFGNKPVANTALILMRYIDGFNREIEKVIKSKKDSLDKIEKLYNLNASRDALKIIERMDKKISGKERSKMLYIKARCLEDLSMKGKAIKTYQEIINRGDDVTYARSANRRIYIAGALANNVNGDEVKKLAIKNNSYLHDRTFKKMLQEETKLRKNNKKNKWLNEQIALSQVQKPVIKPKSVDSLKSLQASISIKKPRQIRKKPKTSKDKISSKGKTGKVTVRIKTSEGNVFIGTVKKETANSIVIQSILGNIEIPKKNIAQKTIMK